MTPIARILRGASAATLALGLVGVTGLVGAPAQGAAVPKPRSDEWWFTAWDIQNQIWQQTRGQGMTVAVVDTGVNAGLPELRSAVVPGIDARRGGTGDGRTDIRQRAEGHGTGMAALIASRGGPSGLVGIAPEAKILPIIVDSFPTSVSKAIEYAADHGAQVINVSQGSAYPGGCPGDVQAAVSHAVDKGAVVVASMGDDGDTTNGTLFPAGCAGVLGVGAITDHKLAWTKTERQPYVSVAAPGIEVGLLTKSGRYNGNFDGTSQAAALASGAVALIRSKFPQMSPRQVVQKIINTAVDAGPPGKDNMTGSGAMVPIFALNKDVPANAPNPTFQRLDQWRAQNPALAKPSNAASASPSNQAASEKSDSGPGLAIPIVAGIAVIAVLAIVIVAVRRRGGPRPAAQGSYPGGPPPYQQPPTQHGGPQGPPSFEPPQGPPQSFGPPNDRGGPPR